MKRGRLRALILGVVVLALAAAPAAAAQIQHYTDSQGTLHISNVPRASRAPATPAAPPAEAPAPEGVAAPATVAPEASQSAAASTPTPPPEQNPLPLKKVAWSPPEPHPGFSPPAAASSQAPSGESGPIRRYRDAQGVLHIDNAAPAMEPGSPSPVLATGQPLTPDSKGEGLAEAPATHTPPGLRKVSWTPDDPSPTIPPEGSRALASPLPGVIRCSRDKRGVLLISNVTPDGPGPPAAAPEGAHPQKQKEGEAKLAWQPVAWSGDPGLSRPPPLAAPTRPLVFSVGTIRRYRDEKGVWHIQSVAFPDPEVRPVLAAGTAPAPQSLAGPADAGLPAQVPVYPQEGQMAGRGPPAAGSPGSQVVVVRDRRGRLNISNLAPQGPAGRAPPLALAQLEAVILESAQSHRLPVPLIQALIKVESNFVPGAVSPKGAMGLMQLMPDTASFLGVTDPFCPRQNVWAGCRYLRLLLDLFNDSLPLALAAYNAGFQRVINAGFRVPPIRETQEFVTQVMERYWTAITGLRRASASGSGAHRGSPPFI